MITFTALTAAMRYILKAESNDRRGARRKLYCIIAGSAVFERSLLLTHLGGHGSLNKSLPPDFEPIPNFDI